LALSHRRRCGGVHAVSRANVFIDATHRKHPEIEMNQDRLAGMWQQFAGALKENWGRRTDNRLVASIGTQDQVAERIRERRRVAKEESARQLKDFRQRNRNWYPSSQ
jgi:uncharacterized protein YjbJ (UPF0337 family)